MAKSKGTPKFNKGDHVQLTTGGPIMAVEELLDDNWISGKDGQRYRCQWFSGKKLESGVFPVESLIQPKEKSDGDSAEVAKWMADEFEQRNELRQSEIVFEIAERFGQDFVYDNQNGNLAINPKVLGEFRKLTKNIAVWELRDKLWRKREPFDEPGRKQP